MSVERDGHAVVASLVLYQRKQEYTFEDAPGPGSGLRRLKRLRASISGYTKPEVFTAVSLRKPKIRVNKRATAFPQKT